jgi:hypothetical protein
MLDIMALAEKKIDKEAGLSEHEHISRSKDARNLTPL